MTSHNIRKLLGFSQKDLADCFGIPIATVRNWDSKNCMPTYIVEMLSYIYDCEKYNTPPCVRRLLKSQREQSVPECTDQPTSPVTT